jgi:hypothetical protein
MVEDREDFTYLVSLSDGPTFHFREVTPGDFYFAQVLQQSERSQLELIERILINSDILDETTSTQTRYAVKWAVENLLDQTLLTVENWLETAYHLCKQRWDSSIEWLETQPMSKINLMIDIVKKHAEEQEKEMKKNARRKK